MPTTAATVLNIDAFKVYCERKNDFKNKRIPAGNNMIVQKRMINQWNHAIAKDISFLFRMF